MNILCSWPVFLLQREKQRQDGKAKRGKETSLILTTEQIRLYKDRKEKQGSKSQQQNEKKTTPQ